jgi:Xaa-Pro aminopeptidase
MNRNPLYHSRIKKLQDQLNSEGLDAIVILKPYANLDNPVNVRYLCNFSGSTASLLITPTKAYIFIDFRYQNQVQQETFEVEPVVVNDSIQGVVPFIIEHSFKRIAIERQKIAYKDFQMLEDNIPDIDLVPVNDWIEKLRIIKSLQEIELHQKAISIAESAFLEALKSAKPGMREIDFATELEHQMRKLGGEKTSFSTIVASGIRSAMPHGIASEKIIDSNDVVTVDWGTIYHGYCSDTTRIFAFKKPQEQMAKLIEQVMAAQKYGVENVSDNLTAEEIDNMVRQKLTKAGFNEEFGHPLGHGVGLDIHEPPRLRAGNTQKLEPKMIITIEPGLYIEGFGGVRIEDMVLVEKGGCRVLNKLNHELFIV